MTAGNREMDRANCLYYSAQQWESSGVCTIVRYTVCPPSCPPFFQEFHRQRTAVCPDNAPFFFIRPLPLLLTPRFSRTSETMYYYIVWTRIFLDSSSIFLEMKKGIS